MGALEKEYLPSDWSSDANILMVDVKMGDNSARKMIYIFYTFYQVIN